jgi:hypothetical protein
MSLDSIIKQTHQLQDLQLVAAIKELKNNPGQLQTFLQKQQDGVYKNIIKQKDDTFQKVYGDLNRSQKVQQSILRYNVRSKELSALSQNMYENQKNQADAVVENRNTFGRKYEMNEWTIGNKKDTLFVYTSLFITLSLIVLFTTLLRMNLISSALWGFTSVLAIIILILIVINRAQYTNLTRDKHFWNKKNYGGKYGKIPIPSICPDPNKPATDQPPILQ